MATTCHAGTHRPAGRRMPIAASGTKTPSRTTSCEPVPRMPSVRQVSLIARPGASKGIAKCSTVGPPSGSSWMAIVMNRSPAGAAAREHLATGDPVAAFHLLGAPGPGDPVGAAAGHEDRLLCRDSAEERLHRAALVAPAPGRDRDLVGVHRQRQRGGSAVLAEGAHHRAQLGVRGAAAAELRRHAGREYPALSEVAVVVGDEGIGGVVGGARAAKRGPSSRARAAQSGSTWSPFGAICALIVHLRRSKNGPLTLYTMAGRRGRAKTKKWTCRPGRRAPRVEPA